MLRVRLATGALAIACHCAAFAAPDIETLENSLVRVIVEQGDGVIAGSGFVLNADGQIATNHHVVNGHKRIAVYFSRSDDLHSARTLWTSAELDLAVIEIEGGRWIPLPLAGSIPSKGGAGVCPRVPWRCGSLERTGHCLGCDGNQRDPEPCVQGSLASPRADPYCNTVRPSILGNSGGPLLDECGRVIGINTSAPAVEVTDADGNLPDGAGCQRLVLGLQCSGVGRSA